MIKTFEARPFQVAAVAAPTSFDERCEAAVTIGEQFEPVIQADAVNDSIEVTLNTGDVLSAVSGQALVWIGDTVTALAEGYFEARFREASDG